jgi:hypothetical protein
MVKILSYPAVIVSALLVLTLMVAAVMPGQAPSATIMVAGTP